MSAETCYFAPEIERSLVSILWHHPRFIDFVHLSLDSDIHFLDPALRTVLEMLSVVYWQIGALDWASVVHALREINAIDQCGGLDGLNNIYTDNGHYPEGRTDPEPFVREYIQLLSDYAIQRQADPTKAVFRFTGGRGTIVPNRMARRENDPAYVGEAWVRGRRYRIRGWTNDDGLAISFYPEGR